MSAIAALARGVVAAGLPPGGVPSDAPRLGGYIFFAAHGTAVDAIRSLTDALRARYADEPPPLLAIDQEGGRVARLRAGLEALPPMMALGAVGDGELALRAGEQAAFDLRRAGCNFDFAPVLDLALESRNTVIGTRSFGSDPHAVASLGAAFARGLERGGVLACYKHFPGHGATATDSHESRPTIALALDVLRERDLVPFARVARHAGAIMGAHVVVTALDARNPASISHAAIAYLRDELGFDGAYLTDCLEMGAIASELATAEAAVEALAAGADLLLFSHDFDGALAAAATIERAALDGRLPLERLQQANARVRRLRDATSAPLALDAIAPHPGVGREAARRAVTLVRGLPQADPVASHAIYFMLEPEARLAKEAPALVESCLALDPAPAEVDAALDAIAANGRRPLVLARRAHLHPAQAAAVERIVAAYPDAVVVSTMEPFDLPLFAQANHLLAAYGDDAASMAGLADVLFGGSMPEGRLPVELALDV